MVRKITNNVDQKIAEYYAPKFWESASRGESQINVWVQGGGKTVIISDILKNRNLIKSCLGPMSTRTKIVEYSIADQPSGKSEEILTMVARKLGMRDEQAKTVDRVAEYCDQLAEENDWEIVLVGSKFEYLTQEEYIKLLRALAAIVAKNKRRIHSIINLTDIHLLKKMVQNEPGLYTLINKIKFMPLINGELLTKYIEEKTQEMGVEIPEKQQKWLKNSVGGWLFLTREYIRSFPDQGNLNDKFKSMWQVLPKTYQKAIKKKISNQKIVNEEEKEVGEELKKLGLWELDIFNEKYKFLESNPLKAVKLQLNHKEQRILRMFIKYRNLLISKEDLGREIWKDKNDNDYSDWAIDQAISRFKKKLEKHGVSKELLVTIKGRGYKWLGG